MPARGSHPCGGRSRTGRGEPGAAPAPPPGHRLGAPARLLVQAVVKRVRLCVQLRRLAQLAAGHAHLLPAREAGGGGPREVGGREANDAAGVFAFGDTVCWGLDAVIDAVPHKVSEGVGKAFQKGAVEFHIVAENLKLDFFVQLVAEISDDACEFPKKSAHWLQAGSHDRILEIGSDRADLLDHGLHLGIVRAIVGAAGYAQEAVSAENHFPR